MQRKLSNFWLRPVHDVCPSELAIWMVRRTPTDIGAAGFQDFLGGLSVGGVGLIASMGAEIGSLRALSVRDRLGTCRGQRVGSWSSDCFWGVGASRALEPDRRPAGVAAPESLPENAIDTLCVVM